MCQHISRVHIEKSRTKSTMRRRREHLLFAKYKGHQTHSYSAVVITPCQAVVPRVDKREEKESVVLHIAMCKHSLKGTEVNLCNIAHIFVRRTTKLTTPTYMDGVYFACT